MSTKVIYSMVGVSKTYPSNKQVLRDISLSYFYGAKIGVIGLNGAGKSTLLRIMAGVEKAFNGETLLTPGYTVGYLEQEPVLDDTKTVRALVEEGVQDVVDALREFDEINAAFGTDLSAQEMDTLLARQARVQDQLDTMHAWDLDSRLELAMDALRCPPGDTPVAVLSGGERRRVALCRLLLKEPDILLLDEPTNHLDAESVGWLEKHLQQYEGTVIAVTHDRYFLDNVAGWILELERGYGIPWKGNYSSWLEQKQQRLAQEAKQRPYVSRPSSANSSGYTCHPGHGRPRPKHASTSTIHWWPRPGSAPTKSAKFLFAPGPRLGDVVIRAEGITKGYGDHLLYDSLTFDVPAGAIVGIIGPNGAGKTTLFRMIVGEEKPDAGMLTVGATVALAYVDQSRDDLDPTRRSGKRFLAVRSRWCWATDWSIRVPMWRVSTWPGATSRKRSAPSPAVNVIVCIWPRC